MAQQTKTITQPSREAEIELLDLIEDKADSGWVGDREYKIRALRKGTRLFVTSILKRGKRLASVAEGGDDAPATELTDKEQMAEDKVGAKCAAAILLNSWWHLRFMGGISWKIYWRWLYYFRQYTDSDYYTLMQVYKKKAEKQTSAYTMNIMLLTATAITTVAMTREEVEHIHLEKSLEQLGAQQKSSQH